MIIKYSLVNVHSKPLNKIVKMEFCIFLQNGKIKLLHYSDPLRRHFERKWWKLSVGTFHSSTFKILCSDGTKINFKHFVWGKVGIHHLLNTSSTGPCSGCCLERVIEAKHTEWKPDPESSDWTAGLPSNKTTTLSSWPKHLWMSLSGLAWTLP